MDIVEIMRLFQEKNRQILCSFIYSITLRSKKYYKIVKSVLIYNIMHRNWIFHEVAPTNETDNYKFKRIEKVQKMCNGILENIFLMQMSSFLWKHGLSK